MSTSGANEFRLGLTPEQEAAEIADLTKDLITEGFRAAIFKREAAIDLGFTHKSFVKHIKTITACIANETIGSALILGVKHEFFESSVRCTLKQFLAFAKFLMSKEGSALLQNAQKTNKLKRRRIGDYSVKDVALEQIFNAQRADWSYVVKKERELFGEQIDEHRRAIRRLERQCDERIKEVSAAFKPAADYIEPMPEDIARVAWEVYVQEAENQEKTPIPRHSGGADHATEHYAPVVRRARLLEFVAQDNHAAMLDEYCKRKICHFRARADRRSENTLKHLVEAIGGTIPTEEALATAEEDLRLRPRGPPPEARATSGIPKPVEVRKQGAPRKEKSKRQPIRTRSQSRSKEHSGGIGDTHESTADSPHTVAAGEGSRHTEQQV
ncbi:TPA_asm: hypothetical protein [Guizotia abyssinica amalgavirus 2]|nr:TPA_asm: hypothetical protein [Guizotia abyssinica amalgavirus 2]